MGFGPRAGTDSGVPIVGSADGPTTASSTQFYQPMGVSARTITQVDRRQIIPVSGTIRAIRATSLETVPTADIVLTLMVDDVATLVTVTVPGANAEGNVIAATGLNVAVVVGHVMSMRVVSGATTQAAPSWVFVIEPS